MLLRREHILWEGKRLGIHHLRIYEWIALYQSLGEDGLITTSKNTVYSAALKANAVSYYLSGKGSYADICKKYQIPVQLRNWIMKYNDHEELKGFRIRRNTDHGQRQKNMAFLINRHVIIRLSMKRMGLMPYKKSKCQKQK